MSADEKPPVSGSLGDYLAAIYVLSRTGPDVRVTDISAYMNISKPSVNRAVNALMDRGLVTHKPYGGARLTDSGLAAGEELFRRHNIIQRFLTEVLHIPDARARREANYIERGVSRDTVNRLNKLTENNNA